MLRNLLRTSIASLVLVTIGIGNIQADPARDYGTVESIQFKAGPLIDTLLVNVKKSWLTRGVYYLDIEIVGLNGSASDHGNMFVAMADMTVFQVFKKDADVFFTWTEDTTTQNVNEVYTACVQVLKEKKGVLELVAEDHCQDFTPL